MLLKSGVPGMRVQGWEPGNVRTLGLTEVAETSVESRIAQTGSVGPVAAPVIGTVTLLIALLPIEALRTACTQETTQQLEMHRSCHWGREMFSLRTKYFVWDGGRQLTILAEVSTDPRRTAASPSDRITAGTIFTLTGEGAVFPKISLGACCEIEK